MADEVAPPPLLTRGFVALGVADLAYFISVGVAIHTLPLYATGPVGSDEAGAGLAFGAFGVTALVCRPIAGRLSDVHGRKPLLVFGALLAAAGMLMLPYVDTLVGVVAIRLLQGVAEASFFVAGFALLADLAPPERLGEALSYNSLGLYLGIAFGPPLGEVVVEQWGYAEAWWVAGVLAVAAAVIIRWVPDVPGEGGDGHGKLIHRPGIPASLGFFASLAAISGFLAFASLWSEDVGLDNTSLALVVYGVVIVACRIVFAKVPDRVPSLPLATGSLVAIAAGLAVLVGWQTEAGLLTGVVVMAVGVTFSTPAFFSAIFATASPAERGAAAGTASAFIDLGLGFGPIVLGLVARQQDLSWAFGVGCAIALVGAAWTALLATRRRSVLSP
ncbi:MFS transporter [Nocardioides bizhenqiangii]|uniref:MFS transporter n=1 Tax=Nocardioides bizhenqiangii TaxID=3095076 RepID=A0ABZ0ZMN1_9ACTN|nr:MFS transporter [Nocardioides sp. HM61]WQQ25305.1 MFS transporter [Nocardioides sp. HM61]